jgi:hypothetical protein
MHGDLMAFTPLHHGNDDYRRKIRDAQQFNRYQLPNQEDDYPLTHV